jgi:hypothetical protein
LYLTNVDCGERGIGGTYYNGKTGFPWSRDVTRCTRDAPRRVHVRGTSCMSPVSLGRWCWQTVTVCTNSITETARFIHKGSPNDLFADWLPGSREYSYAFGVSGKSRLLFPSIRFATVVQFNQSASHHNTKMSLVLCSGNIQTSHKSQR